MSKSEEWLYKGVPHRLGDYDVVKKLVGSEWISCTAQGAMSALVARVHQLQDALDALLSSRSKCSPLPQQSMRPGLVDQWSVEVGSEDHLVAQVGVTSKGQMVLMDRDVLGNPYWRGLNDGDRNLGIRPELMGRRIVELKE